MPRVISTEGHAPLTNFEVRELLRKQQQARSDADKRRPLPGARRTASPATWRASQEAVVIADQVLTYLDETPCAEQTRDSIRSFMDTVERFNLTRAEVLTLVNTQPQTLVEIHLIVEECEERLTPAQTAELLELCKVLCANPRPRELENGGGAMDET